MSSAVALALSSARPELDDYVGDAGASAIAFGASTQAMAGSMSKKIQERYSHANNEAKKTVVAVFDSISNVK